MRSRVRGGMTEADVRQMQEKAANQWMQEDRRGDRRGGAKERRLVLYLLCFLVFIFWVLMYIAGTFVHICTTTFAPVYTKIPGGRGRKSRTARERSAKAARWWSNLFAMMENMVMVNHVIVKPAGQTDCREYCCIQ